MRFSTNQQSDALKDLLASPQAQALAADRSKKEASERVRLVSDRERLETEAAEAYIANGRALAEAGAARDRAEASMETATQAVVDVMLRQSSQSYKFSRELDAIEVRLRETASPEIHQFITWLRDECDVAMKIRFQGEVTVVINKNTGAKSLVEGRKQVTPSDRLRALRDAMAEAEGFKLEANQSNIAARITALRGSLPVVGMARDE